MIEGIGSASPVTALASTPRQASLETPANASSSGGSTAFDIALQIQDVQVSNLKRTLDAQENILDLLA